MDKISEEVPDNILASLKRRVKQSNKEDFDLEEEVKEIVEKEIEFYNRYQRAGGNDRFREKFSEMMFEQYMED